MTITESPESPQNSPSTASGEDASARPKPRFLCDRCGHEMREHKCKITCPNCGARMDCSDLTLYFD